MARADFFRNYQGCEHHSGGDRAPQALLGSVGPQIAAGWAGPASHRESLDPTAVLRGAVVARLYLGRGVYFFGGGTPKYAGVGVGWL